jgi:hypothetical protein
VEVGRNARSGTVEIHQVEPLNTSRFEQLCQLEWMFRIFYFLIEISLPKSYQFTVQKIK